MPWSYKWGGGAYLTLDFLIPERIVIFKRNTFASQTYAPLFSFGKEHLVHMVS